MRAYILLLLVLFFSACTLQKQQKTLQLKITNLIDKEGLNARALEIFDGHVYFAGSNGWVGQYAIASGQSFLTQLDSTVSFRALGIKHMQDKPYIYLLNIASPAYLWEGDNLQNLKKTLIDRSPKAFYNALAIKPNGEGFALGDPVENCMSLIAFGPEGYTQVPCSSFIKIKEGEAAFAASNTNIKILNDHVWVVTGGIHSRVYKSTNMGKTWKAYNTPMVQGKGSQGIYSIDFYNKNIGIAIGGDYTQPEAKVHNLIKTTNGGKTWEVLDHPSHPGYRSCIQFIPNQKGQKVMAVGFKGIDLSTDGGQTWSHLSDFSLYTIRFLDENTAFAAGKNGVYLLELN